ncbi:MAG: PDZ domain-containing protein [Prosthecobacter sp.]|jgi:S1-C subfamily serine protease|uniref:PDZ domain-containing protein n=1 Tax=Prosthecobacter sp. TaxID=1965333 RepID=UPI0019FD6238|nr:PDZ domain-containing protein [Prosthecobacter sp.]MBE2282332.1 PDZ domain-containing protein [Prosthecobacter sp.]
MKFSPIFLLAALCTPFLQAQTPAEAAPKKKRAATVPAAGAEAAAPQGVVTQSRSVVKVNATSQRHNVHLPWQKESPSGRRGLGVVLAGNRVLVTGQMAADATYIELELPETGQKITAKVVAVDYEANLALLESPPSDRQKAFFAGLKPMDIDTSARIGDEVAILQTGRVGELIKSPLTISKVLTRRYIVEGSGFLVYEANNIVRSEANSFTLPVVKGTKLAGLLLSYDSKNQVTTILPAPIIEHFLKDVADGSYEGFPNLGMEMQTTQDEQFREFLGLKPNAPGVLVSSVMKGASAEKAGMKKGDILLSVNGFSIDSRGDYKDPQYGPLSSSHLVRGRAYVGDKVEIKVLREGKEVVLTSELARKQPGDHLVLPYLFDRGPRYVLMGGLLFQELSRPYIDSFGEEQRGGAILRLARIASHPDKYEEEGRKKLVFLSLVLPTPSAQGYDRLGGQVVNKVNGKAINSLDDLADAFKNAKDSLHVIELDEFPHVLYLDAFNAERDNMRLLNGAYRIGSLKRLE